MASDEPSKEAKQRFVKRFSEATATLKRKAEQFSSRWSQRASEDLPTEQRVPTDVLLLGVGPFGRTFSYVSEGINDSPALLAICAKLQEALGTHQATQISAAAVAPLLPRTAGVSATRKDNAFIRMQAAFHSFYTTSLQPSAQSALQAKFVEVNGTSLPLLSLTPRLIA